MEWRCGRVRKASLYKVGAGRSFNAALTQPQSTVVCKRCRVSGKEEEGGGKDLLLCGEKVSLFLATAILVPEKENENENGGKLAYVQLRTVFTYLSYTEFLRSLFRFSVAQTGFAIMCKFYPSLVLTLNSTPVKWRTILTGFRLYSQNRHVCIIMHIWDRIRTLGGTMRDINKFYHLILPGKPLIVHVL